MMLAIEILVALGMGGLLLVTVQLITQLRGYQKLAPNRSPQTSFADLVNWAALVDDGVVVCKGGALMASWMYRGQDQNSSTDEEVNAVCHHVNEAVKRLGSGFVLHIDAVRQASPGYPDPSRSEFPDPVCRAIDEERRRLFTGLGTIYQSLYFITLTWTPPAVAAQKAVKFLTEEDQNAHRKSAQETALDILGEFKLKVQEFENNLSLSVKLTRLKGEERTEQAPGAAPRQVIFDRQLEYLSFCITGESHPIRLPDVPMYLDQVICGHTARAGYVPLIAGKYVQCIVIDGFPSQSFPGILSGLTQLPMDYRWSNRFICLDSQQALKEVTSFRKRWQQKIHGMMYEMFRLGSSRPNQDAVNMTTDAANAETEIQSGDVAGGYYTSVIVLQHEEYETLAEAAKQVVQLLAQLGFNGRVEDINTLDAFMGTLPGHAYENVRRPPLNSANLADLVPTSSIWVGRETAPNPLYPQGSPAMLFGVTHGSTPFRVNLHVRDVGHTLMIGPTGSGKSIHLSLIAAQARRYADMTLFAFDKGHSIFPLAKAIWGSTQGADGLYFDIGNGELAFAPLQFLDSDTDIAWYAEWIDGILKLNGLDTTAGQRNEIARTLQNLREVKERDGRIPSMSDFVTSVQDVDVREALAQYTVSGIMKELLDAREDGLRMSRFTCFEVGELMERGPKYSLPVLLYIFRRIEKSLRGQPAIILLDEAWLMLSDPVFRAKIREWLKTLRRANCAVIMATQSLSDASGSGILDVIAESCATKIFLPNPQARDEENKKIYTRLGLNYRQIEILAGAIPKRQYYLVSEEGKRLYELALQRLALSILGATDREQLAQIRALIEQYQHDWLGVWLNSKGMTLASFAELQEAA